MPVGQRLSLEMDPEGFEAVRSYIKQTYPGLKTKVASTYDRVCFAGSELLHENEWDAPLFDLADSRRGRSAESHSQPI